jgi:hypothetical protein
MDSSAEILFGKLSSFQEALQDNDRRFEIVFY